MEVCKHISWYMRLKNGGCGEAWSSASVDKTIDVDDFFEDQPVPDEWFGRYHNLGNNEVLWRVGGRQTINYTTHRLPVSLYKHRARSYNKINLKAWNTLFTFQLYLISNTPQGLKGSFTFCINGRDALSPKKEPSMSYSQKYTYNHTSELDTF